MGETTKLLETIEKYSTIILWYGKREEQYPSIIIGETPLNEVWEKMRARAFSEGAGSRETVFVDNLLENPRINGFINATLHKMVHKKKRGYIELHGNLDEVYCNNCKKVFEAREVNWAGGNVPRCPVCGEKLKPMAEPYRGEMGVKLEESIRLVMVSEAVIVFGESDVVEPVSHLPWIAKNVGEAKIIEVSDKETKLTSLADVSLKNDPLRTLDELLSII